MRKQLPQQAALSWVYEWGYANAETLAQAAGIQQKSNRAQVARRLVKAGLLVPVKCGHLGTVFCLSRDALGVLDVFRDVPIPYPYRDTTRVNMQALRHDLAVQNLARDMCPAGCTPRSARWFAAAHPNASKIPDAVFVRADGTSIALELELTGKWARALHEMLTGIADTLTRGDGRIGSFVVVLPSLAHLDRYKALWESGKLLRYVRNPVTKRYDERAFSVPADVRARVLFKHVPADRVML